MTTEEPPVKRFRPSVEAEGDTLREFDATAPGAMVMESGVLAGVVLGLNSRAFTLKLCSSVVLSAPPPVMVSAAKMIF